MPPTPEIFFSVFWARNGLTEGREGLKRFLEAEGFILAEFELKPSHMRARYCSEMLFFRFKKAPAGTLLLRNAIFRVQKSPCGHVAAQKCYFQVQKGPCGHVAAQKCCFSGSKKNPRARYCSEMPFFRYKKAPAGMSLLRNVFF